MKPETTLRQALLYEPVELEFGTSGLRGLVKDITDLEVWVAVTAFLHFLEDCGGATAGGTIYLAGDLRPSTEGILVPVCRAIADAGFKPVSLGRIPSPALLLYAMKRASPSVMVTGSHIPFDRNGIKLNRANGEVRKADEEAIRAEQKSIRGAQYDTKASNSVFDGHGALRPDFRPALPAPAHDGAREYARRYTDAFPPLLRGKTILVYQHSAVGRDVLAGVLESLGAIVITAGRSDSFVPVDTEAVNEEMLRRIQELVDANGGTAIQAVVSTDGDGDRPLVLGVDEGRVRFYPGDILGIVTADFVGAREIAVPISVNDAVDIHFSARGITPVKTRIGSPYVIDGMKEVGWEANGGFLTARPLRVPGGGLLEALPTRDAFLPILAALCASLGAGMTLRELFARLPARFGKSGLLREFPREKALGIVRLLSPEDSSVTEAKVHPAGRGSWVITRKDGSSAEIPAGDPLGRSLQEISREVSRAFTQRDGFGAVSWMNWLDGARIGFDNGDIAHVRPSGNAPELRIYATAGTPGRAEAIVRMGTADDGILRRLSAAAEERRAIDLFRKAPCVLRLEGAVQHYAWGGFTFIPSLLDEENPGRLPFAELWIGAHPLAPSRALVDGDSVRLDGLIEAAPSEVLGRSDAARFGGRLPFLLKVLDARVMLSIQAHPDREQAAAGFARESSAGIPLDARERMYRDDNHKPELHVALSEFWLLHGFRPLEEISGVVDSVPELGEVASGFSDRLRKAGKARSGREGVLRELYAAVMTLPQPRVDELLRRLIERLSQKYGSKEPDKDSPDFWALRAARDLPLPEGHMDRGIFSIYLLNLLHLRPGEGTFQPAGTLHAYLEGANVELMASSDNVLRGGLTPKSVDTEELLRIVSFSDGRPPVLKGRAEAGGVRMYESPAEELLLERIELEGKNRLTASEEHGVECIIVLEGGITVTCRRNALELGKGRAALAPAGIPYTIEAAARAPESGGRTLAFRARIPGRR